MKTLQPTALQRADQRAALIDARDLAAHKLWLAQVRLNPRTAARRAKGLLQRRRINLLDPKWEDNRKFPLDLFGRTTADYIHAYESLNHELRRLTYPTFVDTHGRGFW